MAFTLEDGTGLATANAYVSVADFRAYHADRGNDVVAQTDAEIQIAIIRASDYIDRKNRGNFIGVRLRPPSTQRMSWPRSNAKYNDGTSALGVPIEVEEATNEYGFRALTIVLAPDPDYDDRNQKVTSKSEKVGPLEESTTYSGTGATFKFRKYPEVDALLRDLVLTGQEIRRI